MSGADDDWLEAARGGQGPIYERIVEALAAAVREGRLNPGDRLPAQRAAAGRLGVDLTTITRAYSEARARGLVEGTVGRGTFVRARAEDDEAGFVDLSMNLPPPPLEVSLGALIADTTADILRHADPAVLMSYHPGLGTAGQRAAGARWLEPVLGRAPPDRLLVSPGAQAALAAALSLTCKPGDAVVVEPLTYPGVLAAARRLGLRLLACPADEDGLRPDAFEALCAREAPSALYVVPAMQNPTTRTMGVERRRALADAAAAHGAWIIEDDPYSRLMDAPPPAIAALRPERTFHIATLAKCLSPGLRIAYLVCPPDRTGEAAEALRAMALMPCPLTAAVASRWIREGAAERLLEAVKAEARARRALAGRLLPRAVGGPESLHVWLPLEDARACERLRLAAQRRGLALVTAEAFAPDPAGAPPGARISLGGPSRREVLQRALAALAEAVAGAPAIV
ncbi:PLP-dependent aminotransferase family protein [Phenylobacterium sp.]|uniref:aminotransferase-like domain-containing protein n=1 Tax=Phenylobacterium sp. TaxID=1871053 RepID=UPI0035B0767E